MAESICFFTQDTLILKPPKKSPLLLRMAVLMFAMVCSVSICSICVKQLNTHTKARFLRVQIADYPERSISLTKVPREHYPRPKTFSRAECFNNPVRFFAIVSMQRSGSGWFESLLNSHVNVSSNGEVFSVLDRRKNITSIVQTLDRIYNLDWLSSASKNHCSAAVGFKWMLNQGLMQHHEEIADYFNQRGVSTIFIFRRNLLCRIVSVLANSYDRYAKMLNGTHKSHVHSLEEANALSKYKPVINSTSLISDLEGMEATISKALEYFGNTRHIIVYYEDLINNRTRLKDVQEFLNLPQMELRSRQVKIHTGQLSDYIKNWDDVKVTLNGTAYEHLLHADY
ncbi:uncharacterized protein LOC111453839 isoform X2 [Cucurbita moschata]|uniref:Sulfotransferase n=1 Tax=Cucurbita moschata TaxID=3662 RepID=A0A6J1GGZ2_CUCMO|nr:uncharacterized protein LOC111453839 isoform X2 [Cucurbita moschata]XP_022950870.1 uncharacterized protein LOC111453839 isoform X2 [Cucurbita moschata]XP_022950871.1 uncharacterized protein LOC111453839 isoform X2 [Cucurbita moschata]